MGLAEYAKATVEVHLRGLRYFLQFLYDEGIVKRILQNPFPKCVAAPGSGFPPYAVHFEQVNTLLTSD